MGSHNRKNRERRMQQKLKRKAAERGKSPVASVQRRPEKVTVFIDESGNTGFDVQNKEQSTFFALAIVRPNRAEKLIAKAVLNFADLLNTRELKGSSVKEAGLALIAGPIGELIEEHSLQFAIARVDKQYAALVHLFESIFDPDLNPGILDYHYSIRTLRLALLHQFDRCVTNQDVMRFWSLGKDPSGSQFAALMSSILEGTQEADIGERERVLIVDAVSWAMRKKDHFLEKRRGLLDAPNVIALALILDCLRDLKGVDIDNVIHDSQDEFSKGLRRMYELHKNSEHFGRVLTFVRPATALSRSIEFMDSSQTPELQLADVCLWFCLRDVAAQLPDTAWVNQLSHSIARASKVNDFSRASLHHQLNVAKADLQSNPLPPDKEAEYRRLRDLADSARRERLSRLQ